MGAGAGRVPGWAWEGGTAGHKPAVQGTGPPPPSPKGKVRLSLFQLLRIACGLLGGRSAVCLLERQEVWPGFQKSTWELWGMRPLILA